MTRASEPLEHLKKVANLIDRKATIEHEPLTKMSNMFERDYRAIAKKCGFRVDDIRGLRIRLVACVSPELCSRRPRTHQGGLP